MAVHAHPDDEASSTGGILARYSAEGIRTVLVTCTNGEFGDGPGHVKPGEADHDPELVAKTRLAELEASVAALGVSDLVMLGYHDSGMPDWEFKDHEHVFAQTPLDTVADRLAGLFEEYRPQVVVTYADDSAYNHPDHVMASKATIGAFERSSIPTKLYFTARRSTAWRGMREILEAKGVELPPVPPPDPDRERRALEADARITTEIDTKPWAEAKLAALTAHASQLDESWFLKYAEELQDVMFATETFILAQDRVGAAPPEDDLFAGLRG